MHGERLVQFPEVDVVHLEPGPLQKFRHSKHGADAHLIGFAAGDRGAAINAERFETPFLGNARFHYDGSRRAVRQLTRVAGRNNAVFTHGIQAGKCFECRARAITFVFLEHDIFKRYLLGLFIHHSLVGWQRHNLVTDPAGLLGGGSALLTLQRVLVLCLAADAVAFRDDLGRVDHRHVNVLVQFE